MNEIKYYTRINRLGNLQSYALFDNIEFYKNGEYYFNKKHGRMHRYIYEYFKCPIPSGYDVHHIDENKSNNNIRNLEAKPHGTHSSEHKKGKQRSEKTKERISESRKGKKPNYKTRIPEMYADIKNGMGPKEFKRKYTCSDNYYYYTKKEITEKTSN